MKTNRLSLLLGCAAIAFFSLALTSAYAEGPLSKEDKIKVRDEAVKKLNNTQWEIEIHSMDNPKKKAEKDSVVFRSGKIDSKAFAKDGYTGSNLTVNVEDDGHVSWETMQNATGKPPIFWRGDMTDKGINGVISKQLDNGSSESYSFNAIQTGTVEPEPEKKAEPAAAEVLKSSEPAQEAAPAAVEAAAAPAEQAAAQVAPATEEVKAEVKQAEPEKPVVTTSKKKKSGKK